ncbi:MAG: septal ring lytic transglycosylase RlpA family protein [Sulfurimonas sp.]|jgi:rare lipoprotein A|nr:septal ring lytic transglycosylase RlpA family protein [Sulfurimonas sp.]
MNKLNALFFTATLLFVTGCSTRGVGTYNGSATPATPSSSAPTSYSEDSGAYRTSLDQKDFAHPTMRSYVVYGIEYQPTPATVGDEYNGDASWYGPDFHGKLTSNGETYNMYDMTAAHKTLPMNTIVKVTNTKNDLSTVVRINDRGPFIGTRIIDLSNTAARKLDMIQNGTAPVKVEVLGYYKAEYYDRNDIGSPMNKNKKIDLAEPTIHPRPSAPKVLPPGTSYALQIASFSKIESAIKTQETFKDDNGYRAEIKDIENENGRIFKVWIKGFKNEQEVREYKALGYFKNAFIVRED